MKKLLSILAATTMVVSAPLSVVACGDEGGKIGKEFDFDETKIDFMRDITQVYQNSLSKDYEKYFFTSQEDIEDDKIFDNISTSYLDGIIESGPPVKVIERDSKEFEEISKDLKKVVSLENLKKSADSQIVKNVNYRPLLVDGKNPFANSEIDFESISVLKLDQDLFSIQFKTESSYVLKDKTGEEAYETVNYMSSITIFKERDAAEEMKEIAEKIDDEVNSKAYANSFNFESDSGQVQENVKIISKSSNVGTKFVEVGEKVKKSNQNWKDYTFKTDSLKVESGIEKFVPAISEKLLHDDDSKFSSRFHKIQAFGDYHTNTTWADMNEGPWRDFWDNFADNNSVALDDFLEIYQIKDHRPVNKITSNFINPPVNAKIIDTNAEWTRSFNPFFNSDNKNPIISSITKKTPNFAFSQATDLKQNTDAKLLGVFQSEVSGFSLQYKSKITSQTVSIEMPKIQIGLRQNATKATMEVQKEFFAAQFAFFQEFYGLNDNKSNFETFYFSIPEKLESEIQTDKFYEAEELLSAMFDDVKAKVIAKNPEHEKYLNHFAGSSILDKKSQLEYIKISKNLDLSFYTSEKQPMNDWFFSPNASFFSKGSYGTANGVGRIGFSMPTNIDPSIWPDYPGSKAKYKVKYKES
ncbi:hypothetical protein SSABA_v1c08970 [Spiroplasma sabaudiense Ar-1343]|uniref:Lipoprotein n=1 Tax=Spiroplasma sabaudiense Ar-1343 TaxID=1276257 RepID=W6ABC8_9MOLU|nr:lipoprotein [Spiroplasma sabaudiense]AHI54296.1 hypothetical protein SSABA_v1c08970 [Spiroplasma sabaudiense Ar-1343]